MIIALGVLLVRITISISISCSYFNICFNVTAPTSDSPIHSFSLGGLFVLPSSVQYSSGVQLRVGSNDIYLVIFSIQ